jgi:soluble lytic murein transglycosylase-like protein
MSFISSIRFPVSGAVRTLVAATVLLAAAPADAFAQIYAWRDAAGNLVLSDRAKDPSARSYAVTRAGGIRTTRPISRKAARYEDLIQEHAAANGVSPDLVRAVIQAESAFNPLARSPKGAMGLMQLMPATAAELGVDNPYDPSDNIRGGTAYLKRLLTRYDDDVELALAAYNAGPGAVEKYGAVPPYRETRNYVAKVRGTAGASADVQAPEAPRPRTRIYMTVEIVDGRRVVRFTDQRNPQGEIVKGAERR